MESRGRGKRSAPRRPVDLDALSETVYNKYFDGGNVVCRDHPGWTSVLVNVPEHVNHNHPPTFAEDGPHIFEMIVQMEDDSPLSTPPDSPKPIQAISATQDHSMMEAVQADTEMEVDILGTPSTGRERKSLSGPLTDRVKNISITEARGSANQALISDRFTWTLIRSFLGGSMTYDYVSSTIKAERGVELDHNIWGPIIDPVMNMGSGISAEAQRVIRNKAVRRAKEIQNKYLTDDLTDVTTDDDEQEQVGSYVGFCALI